MTGQDTLNQQRFRRSLRLQGYDYRQSGAYFVTICTYQRHYTFGKVIDGDMVLSQWGEIVNDEWRRTETVRANVEMDAYVIMPNNIHGVVLIVDDATANRSANDYHNANLQNTAGSLGQIIGHFKSIATKRILSVAATREAPIWQRGYYEHIIRNEKSLNEIRSYIISNPGRWSEDSLNISGR
ncbi:MAG: hypothetical protein OXG53_11560 [Chloroflexi bacterium]|nr:hypothetical protein [Chloroflexota bacterium]